MEATHHHNKVAFYTLMLLELRRQGIYVLVCRPRTDWLGYFCLLCGQVLFGVAPICTCVLFISHRILQNVYAIQLVLCRMSGERRLPGGGRKKTMLQIMTANLQCGSYLFLCGSSSSSSSLVQFSVCQLAEMPSCCSTVTLDSVSCSPLRSEQNMTCSRGRNKGAARLGEVDGESSQ